MEQVNLIPEKITPTHLKKKAVVYIRQSTMQQVLQNQESTRRQYALQEKAYSLGWPRESIVIIDEDLGISGSGRVARPGFLRLMSMIPAGEVGAVFGLEISRLARSSADMMKMIELCGLFDTLVIDEERIYDISNVDDRMIIGILTHSLYKVKDDNKSCQGIPCRPIQRMKSLHEGFSLFH